MILVGNLQGMRAMGKQSGRRIRERAKQKPRRLTIEGFRGIRLKDRSDRFRVGRLCRDGNQVCHRQVFWLPGHSPAAPSHPYGQWLLRRSSPVTAARPRPTFTAFLYPRRQLAGNTCNGGYYRLQFQHVKNSGGTFLILFFHCV
jgi:hypothetical protein